MSSRPEAGDSAGRKGAEGVVPDPAPGAAAAPSSGAPGRSSGAPGSSSAGGGSAVLADPFVPRRGKVSIPLPGERAGLSALPAYLARPPAGVGPWSGVVVLHEAFGLNGDIRRHADRLAGAGYLAVAPDLLAGGPKAVCLVRTFRDLRAGRGRSFERLAATIDWLRAQPGCASRVGAIGFCLGGGFALLAGVRHDLSATAVNYGEVPEGPDSALAGVCPVVASYGAEDRAMRGRAERLEQALAALDVPHDVKVYPGAGHGFLNRHDLSPRLRPLEHVAGLGYDEAAAEDAWARILAFFEAHLRS